jgi:mannose-1-phosphate guanylyltransferase
MNRVSGIHAAANTFQFHLFSPPIPSRGLPGPDRFRQTRHVNQAFILGAGLGTRLRPLTDRLPKPLIPLFHRPLASWAIEACRATGISRFAINTHHLPAAWEHTQFGISSPDFSVDFFHEPVLLETGGGLKNLASWIGSDPLLIHNGDIFSTLPLGRLIDAHQASGLPVTLAVRSEGDAKHLALDPTGTLVTDIRQKLGRSPGTHVFTGIYCISPEFLEMIPPDEKISVIPAFLNLALSGKLGAVTLDEGVWMDLGDRASYLQAHRDLDLGPAIHPNATISSEAVIERSVIGPGAVLESGAVVRDSVVWPGGQIVSGARLNGCVVFSGNKVSGHHEHEDL